MTLSELDVGDRLTCDDRSLTVQVGVDVAGGQADGPDGVRECHGCVQLRLKHLIVNEKAIENDKTATRSDDHIKIDIRKISIKH